MNEKTKIKYSLLAAVAVLCLCVAAVFALVVTNPDVTEEPLLNSSADGSETTGAEESAESFAPSDSQSESQGTAGSEDSEESEDSPSASVSEETESREESEVSSEVSEESGEEAVDAFLTDVPENLSLGAEFAAVYDITKGEMIYEKKADDICYPASLTKLLTAMVALDFVPLNAEFTVGSELELVQPNSSLAYLREGTAMTLEDLIDALLIPSGNDAAYVIAVGTARYLKGDELNDADAVNHFITLMNEKAVALGCTSSAFANPDGYDQDGHYTTTRDMMKICLASLSYEPIKASVAKEERTYYFQGGGMVLWTNSNLLLQDGSFNSPLATGLKTGSTGNAGYCLSVSAEDSKGRQALILLMKAHSNSERYTDALAVMNCIFD